MSRAIQRVAALGLALGTPGAALAGGLARPTNISARGVGMGGAFVAIADDPTALHFNPAGAAFADPAVHVGVELVKAPRSYVPIDPDGARGPAQSPANPLRPVPVLGVLVRVSDRVTLGAGVWNTYGGQLAYPVTGAPAIDETRELVLELVTGLGYRVNDRFSVGATVRVGVGLFMAKATDRPVTSDLRGTGIGVGASLGAMWRPHPRVTLGGVWRSGLTVDVAGEGTLELPGQGDLDVQVAHEQAWPQSAAVGVALAATNAVRISTQLEWTQWSRFENLQVQFPGNDGANQSFPLDWDNTLTARAGIDWQLNRRLALRTGVYFDGNAVPDRTLERQYLDRNKVGGAVGAGIRLGRWKVDLAGDVSGGPPRTVPDNSDEVVDFPSRANLAPGEYQGTVMTFEFAVARGL